MTEQGDAATQQAAGVSPGPTDDPAQDGGDHDATKGYVTSDDLKAAFSEFARTDLQKTFQGLVKATDKKIADAISVLASQEPQEPELDSKETATELALKKTQTELQKIRAELDQTKSDRQRADREGKLRDILSEKVSDQELAMAYFRERLKVDSDGNFYGEDENGGIIGVDEFVQKGIAAKASLQPASGKSGGGGTRKTTKESSAGGKTADMTNAQYHAKLAEFATAGDQMGMHAFQATVVSGDVVVAGVNDGE